MGVIKSKMGIIGSKMGRKFEHKRKAKWAKKGLHSIPLYHHHRMAGPWNKSAATATWELWLY